MTQNVRFKILTFSVIFGLVCVSVCVCVKRVIQPCYVGDKARETVLTCVCKSGKDTVHIFVYLCVGLSQCLDAFMGCLCVFVIMYVYVKITYYCL